MSSLLVFGRGLRLDPRIRLRTRSSSILPMRNRCRARVFRSSLMGLVQAVYVTLLPGLAQAQAILPCPGGTNFIAVASSDDAATLARSLQCSNGTFIVKWFGGVVVSQTLNVTQGTSLDITGASAGATVDGNHTTQLFAVDGASALHLMDVVLTNGNADLGGACLLYTSPSPRD